MKWLKLLWYKIKVWYSYRKKIKELKKRDPVIYK